MNKKGDVGYYLRIWNDNTVTYEPCSVYSCGKKNMILMSSKGECLGRNFNPNLKIDFENPKQAAFEMAKQKLEKEIQNRSNRLIEQGQYSEGYIRFIKNELERLNSLSPCSITYEEAIEELKRRIRS